MRIGSLRSKMSYFSVIYNRHDEYAKGRLISLLSALITSFYNVFITGIFYTGFLTMYGISITDFGVITFIPYIANCFSLFSSSVLKNIKKRKWALLGSKVFYYFMYIVAVTVMPEIVTDQAARMYWFIAILFVGNAVYALFNPGITAWFYNFYPKENHKRNRYILLNQVFSSIMSCIILLLSGILTDAVAGSPHQKTLIISLRYLAFFLVLIDVFMQSRAKEYPYAESENIKLYQVFTLPFKYKKFILCMGLMFFWNFIANLNNGLWNYHLLNHMHFSYTLINSMSMMYTAILIALAPVWQRILRRFSWVKTFGLTNLVWVPTEFAFFMMTIERGYLYVPLCVIQNILSVGLNLSYANILYMNLPEENSTMHVAFNIVGCNFFAFLGLLTGTFVSSITGDETVFFMGMNMYSVQLTTVMRGITMFIMGIICTFGWKAFSRESDIREIEERNQLIKASRKNGIKMRPRLRIKRFWRH
ncbi:MAG: MFS transporter [Clostridia bacterium]|nr:MFS transporter [Clostridia bacterium]